MDLKFKQYKLSKTLNISLSNHQPFKNQLPNIPEFKQTYNI